MNTTTELPRVPVVAGRQDVVLERCAGRRVLHLGCVDAGLLEDRFQGGRHMHQRLALVASELWGVDIDAEGIEYLRREGYDNLLAGDLCEEATLDALRGREFDVLVATEIVEHLDNPGLFLDAVMKLLVPGRTELVVTVPNAFGVDALAGLLAGEERVHPDHNYWFSYHTITTLLRKRGYEISEVAVYSHQPLGLLPELLRRDGGRSSAAATTLDPAAADPRPAFLARALAFARSLPRRAVVSFLYRRTPFWGDGIVVVARAPGDRASA